MVDYAKSLGEPDVRVVEISESIFTYCARFRVLVLALSLFQGSHSMLDFGVKI